MWRRRTGIEPAERGSLVPTALKAAGATRSPDASGDHATNVRQVKKLLLLILLLGLGAFAAKKLREA
jgi:hypothetical protein